MNHEKFTELEHIINETYSNITGIVIEKDGVNIYENYFNGYGPTDAVHVASVTKSLFSLLLGIAVDKGLIKSLDKKVLDFFPDFDPGYNKTARDITIKDMITMTAPYKCDVEPFIEFFASDNWLNFALNLLGGDGNIGNFRYAPIAVPHILSGIFTKATGKSLLDFAVENLFTYLEIDINNNVHVRTKEEHIAVLATNIPRVGWLTLRV
jgi:CubicO group peptidase (beta-lactamase class C family)